MVSIEMIYCEYLKQKGLASNRAYRLPKDPELSLEKIRQKNQSNYDNLNTLTTYLNTKWQNIDYEKYLKYGFELYPNLSYNKLLDEKIIKYYIQKDKINKFHAKEPMKEILNSFKYIKTWLKENNLENLKDYCCNIEDSSNRIVNDYIKGKIDPYSLVYCMFKGYFNITKNEKDLLYSVLENITTYKQYIKDRWDLLNKMENSLCRN